MIARVPEPEVMDDAGEVEAYRQADFRAVNRLCARRAARAATAAAGRAIDLGCGPAEIPAYFCQLKPNWQVTAVDASRRMLAEARARIRTLGLEDRIRLVHGDAKSLRPWRGRFDLVFSNSLLHHLEDPAPFWLEVRRLLRPGGRFLVQDLFRPASRAEARRLVAQHARGASSLLRRLFHQSLLAAFTPEEVREQLRQAGIAKVRVRQVSDRHLIAAGEAAG